MEDKSFIGTGWSFPPKFFKSESSGVKMVSGEVDINESLKILLSTTLGERNMHPYFGCDLALYMFEEMSQQLITSVKTNVTKSIQLYEPRINLDLINVTSSENEEGLLIIEVHYTIRSTNTRNNFVFPFYINEATELNV